MMNTQVVAVEVEHLVLHLDAESLQEVFELLNVD